MPAEKTTKVSENRRSNKPIMEKRRRARINSCLNDLKALILEALKKDPARHSKLEKADILEMTVKHLQSLHRQQMALTTAADPNISNKFRAGFNECASEVTRYLGRIEGLEPGIRKRLIGHLLNCMTTVGLYGGGDVTAATMTPPTMAVQSMNVTVGPLGGPPLTNIKPCANRRISESSSSGSATATTVLTSGVFNGLQLIPTQLPNGDFALLLPGNYSLQVAPFSNNSGASANILEVVTNNGATTNDCSSASSPASVTLCPVDAPSALTSIPLNLPSPRFQDVSGNGGSSESSLMSSRTGMTSRNVESPSFGQEQPGFHWNDPIYNRLETSLAIAEEEKTENYSRAFTSDILHKESSIKKDPWRPW